MPRYPRIHIVGSSPRSGTTLAFELVTSCFEIEKFGDHEVSIFERPAAAKGPYVSKQPNDLGHVARVLKWDPALFCIFIDRDPRDVVVSQHGSRPGEYWCDYRVWERNQQQLKAIKDHPRLYICRYEDLVTDPDAEQARMMQAFPFLTARHKFSEFDTVAQSSEAAARAMRGIRKISPKSVGSWKNHLPRIAGQLARFPRMAAGTVAAGYAQDASWAEICRDVAPDMRQSVRRSDPQNHSDKNPLLRFVLRIPRRLAAAQRTGTYILRSLLAGAR